MYTKYQIALQYSPELDKNSVLAVRRLRIRIDRCTDLRRILILSGSKRYNKKFTSQQVRLIYHYLGKPPFPCDDSTLFDKYILQENDYNLIKYSLEQNN